MIQFPFQCFPSYWPFKIGELAEYSLRAASWQYCDKPIDRRLNLSGRLMVCISKHFLNVLVFHFRTFFYHKTCVVEWSQWWLQWVGPLLLINNNSFTEFIIDIKYNPNPDYCENKYLDLCFCIRLKNFTTCI